MNNLSQQQCDKLGDITDWITQGPNPTFVDYVDIPCLTGRNISNGRVTYDNADYVSADTYAEYARFQLHANDTLITLKGKGSIGKIGFVTTDKQAIFSRNIGVVRPKTNIDAAYLNAYILSYYGQNMVLRGETGGTGQSTLTCTYIKSLDIPRFNIEKQIGDLIRLSESVLTQANDCYKEAEQYLCDLLKINKLILPEDNTSIVLASQSFAKTHRLDAEYYQPKYDELINLVKSHQSGYGRLETLFLIKDRNYIPENDCLYKYIELSNIGSDGSITGHTEALGEDLPSRARRIVRSGDLIVSSLEGSLNSCAIIPEKYDGAICSTGFYVLTPKDINVETALVIFKSQLMQALMTRVCSGSIMAGMNTDEFANIIVPKIDQRTQHTIAEIIQDCSQKRDESIRLLELAKTAVEIAIEQGEDKAMELLTQNM